jgi:hypothetical protein
MMTVTKLSRGKTNTNGNSITRWILETALGNPDKATTTGGMPLTEATSSEEIMSLSI